ncbi:ABC transporter permease [Salinispora sp. H7-4]|uniref:ABC transporter permease n=1 Tax=Salinispora sp. H7-4 TaxID=2748321 RepID=UPI0015D39D2E|nr:ABC transporter permease [Salinispora sp. H7-4]NYT92313.1 ABC transporter permease [Salinispora sp. H7-4]
MLVLARTQWQLIVRSPGLFAVLLVTPLYSVVFFSLVRHHRGATAATAVALTAFGMSMWSHAVFVASRVVDDDRIEGTLEYSLLTPATYLVSLVFRVTVSSALSLPVLGEVLLVGRLFGLPTRLADPLFCLLVAVILVIGTAGAALLVSGLLVLVRAARTMQNTLTYPFYLLGGLTLPVSWLPPPFRWVADCFFLSHGFQLLRDAAAGDLDAPAARLGVLLTLTVAQVAVGVLMLRRVLRSARSGAVPLHH